MYSVYALCDPRTGDIRYIGSAKDIHKRYGQHLLYPHENEAKDTWMKELKRDGRVPTFITLETDISKQSIRQREIYWIAYYLKRGFDLTNIAIPGYRPRSHMKAIIPIQEITVRVTQAPNPQEHNFVELEEAAKILGVSEDTIIKNAKKLGGFHRNKKWHFSIHRIHAYLER